MHSGNWCNFNKPCQITAGKARFASHVQLTDSGPVLTMLAPEKLLKGLRSQLQRRHTEMQQVSPLTLERLWANSKEVCCYEFVFNFEVCAIL